MSLGFDPGGRADAYARAALDRECELAATTGHGRNDQLNSSAFSLGQIVGAGLLDRGEVERRLFDAARASGYVGKDGPLAARSTIKSGLDHGLREPRTAPADGHAGSAPGRAGSTPVATLPSPRRPAPVLRGVALPAWTPPGEDGKPTFYGVGIVEPKSLDGEERRHVYRRDGEPIRVKVKLAGGGFRDFYRVRRPEDGAVGWQARKPEGYVPMPYLGPVDGFDPFDPEMIGETLFWPEGEKDVDTLQRAGLVAFTFGGASDVPDCGALLAGRDLVILGDNDAPGERCVARKADLALAAASRVRVVRFPELTIGGDVTDWLAAGNAPEGIEARAEAPPEPAAPFLDAAVPIQAGDVQPPIRITAHGFVWRDPATFPRRRWLYGHHLIRKFISSTVSPGGVGKTSLILVEAIAMCTGLALLGVKPREAPLRVWVYNLEDPLEELERRVVAICLLYGIDPAPLQGRLFLDSGRDQALIVARQDGKAVTIATPVVDALTDEIRARQIDVLVVDPFVSCHRVNENDNGAIDDVAKTFAGIADKTSCAVDLVHHVRKGHGDEITVEDGRGAVALLGAVRSARVLNPMTEDEAERAGVENRRQHFRVTNGKANLAPPASASSWFRLTGVSLGNGSGGMFDDADHVGVVEPWSWPNAMDGVTLDDLKAVQRIVSGSRWRDDVRASEWVGKAVARVLRLDVHTPVDKSKILGLLGLWIKNAGLRIQVNGVQRRGSWSGWLCPIRPFCASS